MGCNGHDPWSREGGLENINLENSRCLEKIRELSMPRLDHLILTSSNENWGQSLNLSLFSTLRKLRVETVNTTFAATPKLWVSDWCPLLEEVTWSIKKDAMKNAQKRKAYEKFLTALGKQFGNDFQRRRPKFRVSVYNGQAPPSSVTCWCSMCNAPLVREETICNRARHTTSHRFRTVHMEQRSRRVVSRRRGRMELSEALSPPMGLVCCRG